MKWVIALSLLVWFWILQIEPKKQTQKRETKTKDAATLILESREAYRGNCPCPYDTDRNGNACGDRSAWSRSGGSEPLCFISDVKPLSPQPKDSRSKKRNG